MTKDDDFLSYLRTRRKELKAELRKIDDAEEVFLASRFSSAQRSMLFVPNAIDRHSQDPPGTIMSMVLTLLEDAGLEGLTALNLLSELREKWLPKLERTSLSPQLSRLKQKGEIENINGKWRLRNKT